MKRPVDTQTKEPIEPAHKFEVTLEPDSFTEEKSVVLTTHSWADLTVHHTDTSFLRITNELSIMKRQIKYRGAASSAFFALALSVAPCGKIARGRKSVLTINVTASMGN